MVVDKPDNDMLVTCVIEVLREEAILQRMSEVLFPKNLMDAIDTLTKTVDTLTTELCHKHKCIQELENKREHWKKPPTTLHNTRDVPISDQLITSVVNDQMPLQPPMLLEHLERSHRLGQSETLMVDPAIAPLSYACGASDF